MLQEAHLSTVVDRMLSRDSTSDLAARAAGQIVSISDQASPDTRAQAYSFQTQIAGVIKQYLDHVVTAERTQVSRALVSMGRGELIQQVAQRLRQQE
jgi:hypothetical protein